MLEDKKKCNACNKIKTLKSFHRNKCNADGHTKRCKLCRNKAYRDKHNGKQRKKRTYDHGFRCPTCDTVKPTIDFGLNASRPNGHDGQCKLCRKAYDKSRKFTPATRYKNYTQHARQKNRSFDLTLEDFDQITNQICIYCGTFEPGKNHTGIDRINSKIGYTLSNCVPCCWQCNFMKSDKDILEFANKIISLAEHLKKNLHTFPFTIKPTCDDQ